jgi:hypothetical protein
MVNALNGLALLVADSARPVPHGLGVARALGLARPKSVKHLLEPRKSQQRRLRLGIRKL